MANALIHDRGRGPELVGTRITVYDLLPHFADPAITEEYLREHYHLSPEQVAAARAYAFEHADTVLAKFLRLEERIAAEHAAQGTVTTHSVVESLQRYREWLENRRRESDADGDDSLRSIANGSANSQGAPSFREWYAAERAAQAQGA